MDCCVAAISVSLRSGQPRIVAPVVSRDKLAAASHEQRSALCRAHAAAQALRLDRSAFLDGLVKCLVGSTALASPNERTDDDVGASWMLAHLLTKVSLEEKFKALRRESFCYGTDGTVHSCTVPTLQGH